MVSPLTNGNPSYFRTQVQDTYSVAGHDETGAWDVIYSTLDELVVTTTDDALPATGLKLGTDKNVLIYADTLTVWRELAIPGKAIKIVCNTLAAASTGSTGHTAITISTSPPAVAQTILTVSPCVSFVASANPAVKAASGAKGRDALDGNGNPAVQNGTVPPAIVTAYQGASAGPIELRCQRVDDSVGSLSIVARGAQGGPGFAGQDGAFGIAGETGKQIYHPAIYNPAGGLPTPAGYGPYDANSSQTPVGGGDGGVGGAGVKGFPGGSGGRCTLGVVEKPSGSTSISIDANAGSNGTDPPKANGGAPGAGATGVDIYSYHGLSFSLTLDSNTGSPVMPAGTRGADGAMLQPTVSPAPTAGAIDNGLISPDQIGFDSAFWLKLLQKLRNLYFYCYPVPDSARNQHGKEIAWLKTRLTNMVASIPATTPAAPDAEDLRIADLRRQAERLAFFLQSGYTVFGASPDLVPDLGFSALTKALQATEATYKDVELAFQNAVASANTASNTSIDDTALLDRLNERQATLQGSVAGDIKVIDDVARRIGKTGLALAAARTALENSIDTTLQNQISSNFSCGVKDVLSALQSLAFAPNEGMALVAGAQLLYNGATKIEGINGVSIDKSLIISKAVTLSSDIGASGSAAYAASGKNLDNTALLTSLDAFDTYLHNLPTTIPAAATVSGEISDFKQLLRQNSALLFEYNATLHNLRATGSELGTLADKIAAAKNGQSKSSDPTLVGLTSYLAAMYQRLQEDAMALLYRAYQAFHCEFLQAPTTAFDFYQDKMLWTQGGAPSFSFTELESAISDLTTQKATIESTTGWTPPEYGAPTHASVTLHLVNTEVLAALAQAASVSFTTVPDSPAGKFQFVPLNTTGFADIRVTRVLPRIIGATTHSGKLDLTITHGGGERFVTVDGDIVGFSHQPIVIPLTLDLSITAGAAYPWAPSEGVLTGGDFMRPGIFTDWSIELTPGDANNPNNLGLDLTKVTAIDIDFCGTYRKKN